MKQATHLWTSLMTGMIAYAVNPIFSVSYLFLPFWSLLPDAENNNRISQIFPLPWKHRTRTHTLWFVLLVSSVFFSLLWVLYELWMSNYQPDLLDFQVTAILLGSHLLADIFTKQWADLFRPIPITFKIPIVRTGYKSEKNFGLLIMFGLIGVITYWFKNWFFDIVLKQLNFIFNTYNSDFLLTIVLLSVIWFVFILFRQLRTLFKYWFVKILKLIIQFMFTAVLPFIGGIFILIENNIMAINNIQDLSVIMWVGLGLIGFTLFTVYKFYNLLMGVLVNQILYWIFIWLFLFLYYYIIVYRLI